MKIIIALFPISSISLVLQKAEEVDMKFPIPFEGHDAADKVEAQLDEQAIENFEPSKHLISEWTKKYGHTFAHYDDSVSIPEMCKEEIKKKLFKKKECADPWIETNKCEDAYEIPGYRLGDEFFQYLSSRNTAEYAKFYFPKSIGDLYWRRHQHKADYITLNSVMDDPEYQDYARPDDTTLVIHVRGYDILTKNLASGVNKGAYQQKNAYYLTVAEKAAEMGFKSATLVTGDHYVTQSAAMGWGNQADALEAIKKTDEKLDSIKQIFAEKGMKVNVRRNMNADCDLIYMVNAKVFVPSGGSFDQLTATLVEMRNGTVLKANEQKKAK